MSADHYTRLLRRRIEHRETLRMFFENYDLLLTPTTPCTAWDIEKALPPGHEASALWSYFTYPFNLTGQPAASIPCGLTEENLPVGLHVVAPMGNEAQLIAALRAIEQTLDSRLRTPVELTRADDPVLLKYGSDRQRSARANRRCLLLAARVFFRNHPYFEMPIKLSNLVTSPR